MTELMKLFPAWFLLFLVVVLFMICTALWAYFLWSLKNTVSDIKFSIQSVGTLVHDLTNELFERMKVAENSLNRLWGEHRSEMRHGAHDCASLSRGPMREEDEQDGQ
jgi:hypothetical protein